MQTPLKVFLPARADLRNQNLSQWRHIRADPIKSVFACESRSEKKMPEEKRECSDGRIQISMKSAFRNLKFWILCMRAALTARAN